MNLYEKMKAEAVRLSAKIQTLENTMDSLPEGTLQIQKNGRSYKHLRKIDGHRKYIRVGEIDLIFQLAKKTILKKMLQDSRRESRAVNAYLHWHREQDSVEECLAKQPHLAELTRPLFQIRDERLRKWAEDAYPSTAGHPEDLIHAGPCGKMYRSKTEASIAYILYKKKIPFRYEWDREIGGIVYHIDFTIRHPKTGEFYFWEHFGRIDDIGYVMRNAPKICDYESAGIVPGINLIVTCESRRYPMTISRIEEIVDRWFLQDE